MSATSFVRARAVRCAAAVLAAATLVALAAVPQAGAALRVGGLPEAVTGFAVTPNRVAGANDWSCRPSAAHPEPVVLVHATFVNMGANWPLLSPLLKNDGRCVFALNYGMTRASLGGRIGGLGDIPASAATLAAFVDRVLTATGATKVDLVGHSQGGMMPHYYLKRLGGAGKVRRLVGLAPSNRGTDLYGLMKIPLGLGFIGKAGLDAVSRAYSSAGVRGLFQQTKGSAFQDELFADGDTVPGVGYTVISTRYDLVITPWQTQRLAGPDVRNILIQELCPRDTVGHVGLFIDWPAMQLVRNALGANDPAFQPECRSFGYPV